MVFHWQQTRSFGAVIFAFSNFASFFFRKLCGTTTTTTSILLPRARCFDYNHEIAETATQTQQGRGHASAIVYICTLRNVALYDPHTGHSNGVSQKLVSLFASHGHFLSFTRVLELFHLPTSPLDTKQERKGSKSPEVTKISRQT